MPDLDSWMNMSTIDMSPSLQFLKLFDYTYIHMHIHVHNYTGICTTTAYRVALHQSMTFTNPKQSKITPTPKRDNATENITGQFITI